MAILRTQGQAFLFSLVRRVLVSAILCAIFVGSVAAGSLPVAIVVGIFLAFEIFITVALLRIYRQKDAGWRQTLIDRSQRPRWRYLRPNKYPYVPQPGESQND
jgi:hypothetical protein